MADYRDLAAALGGGYGQDIGPITPDTLLTLKNGKTASVGDLLGLLKGYGQAVGSNLESLGRGGVASVIGAGGDLESLGRMGINKLYGAGGVNVNPTPVLPTTTDILGMMPRATAPRQETAGMEELGGFMTPATAKVAGKAIKITEGLPVGMGIKDVSKHYPQQAALDLAQQRAALPVEQGGLGLPANNTAADRAKAMGFDVEAYHGTASKDIQKFMPEGGTPEGEKTLEWYKNRQAQNKPVGYMAFRGGSFFSPKADYAGSYAPEGTGVMYPVNLRMENPLSLLPNAQGRYSATNAPDINKTIDAMILQDSLDKSINEIAIIDPAQIRSRFAAYDPFRKDVATATAMGVALPDLLAAEKQDKQKKNSK